MDTVDRIRRALADQKLDPGKFERAACALLRPMFPHLSPVESGTDLGRDADIYGPISGDPESRGRVLCTTGDPLKNLKSSHASWKKSNLRVDQLVIACSRPVTGTMRRKLDAYCAEYGIPIPEVFGQDWFVEELRRNSEWRTFLTGVAGRLSSLAPVASTFGAETLPLEGRDAEFLELRDLITEGDVLVYGVPGVGKSRLLAELGTDAFLADPAQAQYFVDDLLDLSGELAVVILDDAHFFLDALRSLVKARAQEGLSFTVIAVTWPDEAEAVGEVLMPRGTLEVPLLPRDHVDAIVRASGVTGVLARKTILDQAQGRPGWALALARTLVGGNGYDLVSGGAMLDQVMRYFRMVSRSETGLDALACVAGLRGINLDEAQDIALLVGMPLADVTGLLRRLATNGLLEYRDEIWTLQPPLAPSLTARWFFGEQRRRPWRSLLKAFPDRARDLHHILLDVAVRFPSDEVLDLVRTWAHSLPDPLEWDELTAELVRDYCLVDQEAARFGSLAAIAILAADRPIETDAWGNRHDELGIAAVGILTASAQRWLNPEAVQGLLEATVDDKRPRYPERPLTVLTSMVRRLGPEGRTLYELRPRLVQEALSWFASSAPTPQRWVVLAECVRHALNPEVEGAWTDPAAFRNVTFASRVESPQHIRSLVQLWNERVLAALLEHRDEEIPAAAVNELAELLETWIRLRNGHGPMGSELAQDQRDAATEGVWALYRGLSQLAPGRPGLALRLSRALDRATHKDAAVPSDLPLLELDEDLVLLCGRRDAGQPPETWHGQHHRAPKQLAQRLLALGPAKGSDRFMELVTQARYVDGNIVDAFTAHHIAQEATDPAAWFKAACDARAPALAWHCLHKALTTDQETSVDPDVVHDALQNPELRGAVVRAALSTAAVTPLITQILDQLDEKDADLVNFMASQQDHNEVLAALLTHRTPALRAAAATAFDVGAGHGAPLPEEWQDRWKDAFLQASPTLVRGHDSWLLQETLQHLAQANPQLCADWFEARLHDPLERWWVADLSDFAPTARNLPTTHREHLVRAFLGSERHSSTMLVHLIGHDAALAARLLQEGTIDTVSALNALSGERDSGVEILAPILLEHKVPPDHIALRITSMRSWAGNESDSIRNDITWFTELQHRHPELEPVVAYALEFLTRQLEQAIEKEHDEAIKGWS